MRTPDNRKIRVFTLIITVLIPLLVGGFSAYLTASDMDIYETLTRPPFAPPGWLFPIVWTILYILMGVASYLVVTAPGSINEKRTALYFYFAQLAMNLFWSTLFFTYRKFLMSLIWLLGMWVLILITGIRFYKINRTAGLMIGVLFLWTTFAAYLNLAYFIISLNGAPEII